MKNLKAPFLVIALFLNVLLVSADTSKYPPPPGGATAKSMSTAAACDDPGSPSCNDGAGIPIDQNIVFLIMAGLALGLTVIYKNQIKKASI